MGHTSNGWATAQEVEYPTVCLKSALLQHGAQDLPGEMLQHDYRNFNLHAKAGPRVPVRGKRLYALGCANTATQFAFRALMRLCPNCQLQQHLQLSFLQECRTTPATMHIPKHAKQIKPPILLGDGAGVSTGDNMKQQSEQKSNPETWQVEYGVPWGPLEFVKPASGLSRPGLFLDGVHEVLLDLFRRMKGTSAHAMALDRTEAMRKWSLRCAELKSQGSLVWKVRPHMPRRYYNPKI